MRETRRFPLTVEVRADDDGAPLVAGHAAVFNSLSHDLGGFRETIKPGAFKRTLKSGNGVMSFFNHNPDYVLGRTSNKTLTVAEDLEGLAFQVKPPETAWAADLMTSMRRGDVEDASFSFRVVKDEWGQGDDGAALRTLIEVELFEVGPVTMGAYPAADSGVRALLSQAGLDPDAIAAVLQRRALGRALTDADRELIAAQTSILSTILPTATAASDPGLAAHSLDIRRRRQTLLIYSL